MQMHEKKRQDELAAKRWLIALIVLKNVEEFLFGQTTIVSVFLFFLKKKKRQKKTANVFVFFRRSFILFSTNVGRVDRKRERSFD